MRRLAACVAAAAAFAPCATASAAPVPHINHVFLILLENEDASSTFGAHSDAPYLANTLRSRGAFVPNYYGIAHNSLTDYVALVSGQAANILTQADCPLFLEFLPGLPAPGGQYIGQGCVYPKAVRTVANQLSDSGHSWKGYMEDMGRGCRHPALNGIDNTQNAEVGDQYATRHNPFAYFHSIIDRPAYCKAHDVDYSRFATDLQQASTTPDYSFITPNLCNDGHDEPCVTGEEGGLDQINAWLRAEVPQILASPGFQHHGMLVITFDEAEGGSTPGEGDASACCNEQPGFNTPNPGALTLGPGGGRVGAVVLSPCIQAGTRIARAFNHYSLLKTVEHNFGLPYLGYAGQAGLSRFGPRLLNDPTCSS